MCHQPLSDKGWLRQLLPSATPEQIYRFTERVGIKVDSANPTPARLQQARLQAAKEMGYVA